MSEEGAGWVSRGGGGVEEGTLVPLSAAIFSLLLWKHFSHISNWKSFNIDTAVQVWHSLMGSCGVFPHPTIMRLHRMKNSSSWMKVSKLPKSNKLIASLHPLCQTLSQEKFFLFWSEVILNMNKWWMNEHFKKRELMNTVKTRTIKLPQAITSYYHL